MNVYDVKIKKEMNINYNKQLNSQTQITVCTTHTYKEGFSWSILILKATILLCFIVSLSTMFPTYPPIPFNSWPLPTKIHLMYNKSFPSHITIRRLKSCRSYSLVIGLGKPKVQQSQSKKCYSKDLTERGMLQQEAGKLEITKGNG